MRLMHVSVPNLLAPDIVVVVGECGNQEPVVGLLQYNDDGNDFKLTVSYTYQPALD